MPPPGISDSTTNLANAGESKATATTEKGTADATKDESSARKVFNYPLVKYTEMNEETRVETVDLVVTYLEKYPGNFEASSKNIKEVMDKKFGTSWHVVIGEGYEFEISCEMKNILFMYFGTNGVLIWKAN